RPPSPHPAVSAFSVLPSSLHSRRSLAMSTPTDESLSFTLITHTESVLPADPDIMMQESSTPDSAPCLPAATSSNNESTTTCSLSEENPPQTVSPTKLGPSGPSSTTTSINPERRAALQRLWSAREGFKFRIISTLIVVTAQAPRLKSMCADLGEVQIQATPCQEVVDVLSGSTQSLNLFRHDDGKPSRVTGIWLH
ncbi:hypothetical protein EV363DRAFT_1320409, partial [Boletus edulis]